MICVVLSEKDFETQFKILDETSAVKNEDESEIISKTDRKNERDQSGQNITASSSNSKYYTSKIRERQNLDRKINQALRRYKQRTFL